MFYVFVFVHVHCVLCLLIALLLVGEGHLTSGVFTEDRKIS